MRPESPAGPVRVDDVRGLGRLAVEATRGIVGLVETMHANIAAPSWPLGGGRSGGAGGIAGLVYASIRGVTRVVGGSLDLALGALAPRVAQSASGPERDALLSALNGVLGDHLERSANPLALSMCLCHQGLPLALDRVALAAALPAAGPRILLLVHGLCMNDRQWRRNDHDHGAALAALGYTPVYLRYNSGRHISHNGRELAALLQALVSAWPLPPSELAIVGHSMGGLVARSACAVAAEQNLGWLPLLRSLAFLGSPHFGAPLEKGGSWVDALLGASPYTTAFKRLGQIRSAGITDLRHGYVSDADWRHADRFARRPPPARSLPLPAGVRCLAIAGTLARSAADPARAALGDGLVMPASALGRHKNPARDLALPASRRILVYATGHLALLDSTEVLAHLRSHFGA